VLAGLLDFVPYFGPILSGVLIVAVALTEGESKALLALVVVVAVQQAEAFVVQPLAQRWAVRLPPVLGLLSVLVFGVLFGLAGVLLATPLMVLTLRVVDHLVVRGLVQGRTT
jgi:predicted PurR-regulated permease PerM